MRAPLALPFLAIALASPTTTPRAAPAEETTPKETPLAVLSGTIRSVDLGAHTLVVDLADGEETLRLDRNTLVYLPGGLATVAALRRGDAVRAGRSAAGVAYWIEVRRADVTGRSAGGAAGAR